MPTTIRSAKPTACSRASSGASKRARPAWIQRSSTCRITGSRSANRVSISTAPLVDSAFGPDSGTDDSLDERRLCAHLRPQSPVHPRALEGSPFARKPLVGRTRDSRYRKLHPAARIRLLGQKPVRKIRNGKEALRASRSASLILRNRKNQARRSLSSARIPNIFSTRRNILRQSSACG